MQRRLFLVALGTATIALLAPAGIVSAGPRARIRRHRRRVRRRIRRRHRRRVTYRMVHGRRCWVVPLGLAVGWELLHEDRVVVVREIRVVETDGVKSEVVVVHDVAAKDDAPTDEIAVVREDTKENTTELEGSRLPDDDDKTPGVTVEVEDDEEDENEDEDDDEEDDDDEEQDEEEDDD